MYKKRKNQSNENQKINHKKIIRCRLLMRPVLEQETCSNFIPGKNRETGKYCMNCKHSF